MNGNDAFRGEYLAEFRIAEGQLTALADAFTPEQYDWRPSPAARAVSAVLVHIAGGNFLLLDLAGVPVPEDLYGSIAARGMERVQEIIRVDDALEREVRAKPEVAALLRRALAAAREAFSAATTAQLEMPSRFFAEQTTVRRIYMRMLAHMHEHMGQMIAYARAAGVTVPWPDWRPDRRSA